MLWVRSGSGERLPPNNREPDPVAGLRPERVGTCLASMTDGSKRGRSAYVVTRTVMNQERQPTTTTVKDRATGSSARLGALTSSWCGSQGQLVTA